MPTSKSKELNDFFRRFVGTIPAVPPSVFAGVSFVGDFALLTLLREGKCQAQMTLCKPNAEIPDHSHPNVEANLIYVTGQIDLRLDGKSIYAPGQVHETAEGRCSQNDHFTYIAPGQLHGATIGPKGGAFITVQRWLKGDPTSVEEDWEGPVLSEQHGKTLEAVFAPL